MALNLINGWRTGHRASDKGEVVRVGRDTATRGRVRVSTRAIEG